ncbi:MAG: hypothetical protein NVS9B15_02620 [Acidobacteriaceae bacterium]
MRCHGTYNCEVQSVERGQQVHTTESDATQEGSGAHLWLRRVVILLYILVTLQLGIILLRIPWKSAWTENSLISAYPLAQRWLSSNFARGAVSGLGLLNLWIAVREIGRLLRGDRAA